jgi:hypothetical protein
LSAKTKQYPKKKKKNKKQKNPQQQQQPKNSQRMLSLFKDAGFGTEVGGES